MYPQLLGNVSLVKTLIDLHINFFFFICIVFGFSFADVQGKKKIILHLFYKYAKILMLIKIANVLAVLAFKNTSVLSALVLSSWTIPCIMLLSTWFLNTKYSMIHIQSAIVCLIGLAMLIWGDTIGQDNNTGKKKKKNEKH